MDEEDYSSTRAAAPIHLRRPSQTRKVRPLLRSGYHHHSSFLYNLRSKHRRHIPLHCNETVNPKNITKYTNTKGTVTPSPHNTVRATSHRSNIPSTSRRTRSRTTTNKNPAARHPLRNMQTPPRNKPNRPTPRGLPSPSSLPNPLPPALPPRPHTPGPPLSLNIRLGSR